MILTDMIRSGLCICFLLLAAGGCKRSNPTATTSGSKALVKPAIQHAPKIEACSLLTMDEIHAIHGATIVDTKSSEGPGGSFLVSQCYYASAEPNLSVSLAITQPNPAFENSPRDYWNQTFGPYRLTGEKETEREGEGKGKEEEEKAIPPKKVDGVGEEAFWAGNRVGGALYVLKGNVFFRISVGGPGDESVKLEKSKQLAQKALSRLP
jgi:hypothetical protein